MSQESSRCRLRDSGSPLNVVLTRQYAEVEEGHDLVRDLRDAYLDD